MTITEQGGFAETSTVSVMAITEQAGLAETVTVVSGLGETVSAN